MTAEKIQFWLNDKRIETAVAGTTTLLRFLRDELQLTGTKEGCAEGDCGACTVALLEHRDGESPTFRAVNSCLLMLPMLQGKRVYTVEGLRDRNAAHATGYHPAQEAMVETRGSQCGYCTPGIVMSLFEATYREDMGEAWQVDDQLCGNLCRCTGYRPIRQAGEKVAGLRPNDRFRAAMEQYRPQDAGLDLTAVNGLAGTQRYLQPTTWDAFFEARAAHPDAVLMAGGTDIGLQVTKFHKHFPVVIGLEGLPGLTDIEEQPFGWEIGAGVNLTRVMESVKIPALQKMLRWFGSRQVRSRATFGGNLATASPIGDMAPVLAALDAELVLRGSKGDRSVPMDEFFTGYRQTAMTGDEVILRIILPNLDSGFCSSFKVSKRREMDISAVAAGMFVDLRPDGTVKTLRLAYGGVAGVSAARARRAEAALVGRPWTEASIEAALPALEADFTPISDQRASDRYRSLVVKNLLIGFFHESQQPPVVEPFPVGTAAVGGVA